MITPAQYQALGPIGREIIDTDRAISAARQGPIPELDRFRALRQDRRMLTEAAAAMCHRPRGGNSGAGRA